VEPSMQEMSQSVPFQFMREGYFCLDKDSTPEKLIFNRSVSLKDSFKPGKK
jgi:glutaminyl-tRNA synthetase